MTEFHFGKLIGKGMERACYENMDNPNTCFKVSRKEHSKQTIREGAYFKYLQKKNISPSFMPKFIGLYETEDSFILEQECVRNTEEIKTQTLRDFVLNASEEQMVKLEQLLENLREEMLRLNIIVSDMRTTNILVLTYHDKPFKIMIFDGYGTPEFIPLPNFIPFLGAKKIERQWNKFRRYFNEDLQKKAQNASQNASVKC